MAAVTIMSMVTLMFLSKTAKDANDSYILIELGELRKIENIRMLRCLSEKICLMFLLSIILSYDGCDPPLNIKKVVLCVGVLILIPVFSFHAKSYTFRYIHCLCKEYNMLLMGNIDKTTIDVGGEWYGETYQLTQVLVIT